MADLVAWGLGTGQNSLKPGTHPNDAQWSGQPAEWRDAARSGDWHLTPRFAPRRSSAYRPP